MATQALKNFIKQESSVAIFLGIATIAALIFANTPLDKIYNNLLTTRFFVGFEDFYLSKPIFLWVNDGMMALFFLTVGLEVKREIVEGELSSRSQIMLPLMGAIGGVVVPVAVFLLVTRHDPQLQHGWAIPAATDIAFALGVLCAVGKRVPASLKIFLLTLAIFDDLAAIVIIAIFYTTNLSLIAMVIALIALLILVILNRLHVTHLPAFMVVGLIMWGSVLQSGVHATLAGVALAFTIPIRDPEKPDYSPLRFLESKLHYWVILMVLPIFAFCNTGVDLRPVGFEDFTNPLAVGIMLGLFLGKQIGVFSFCWAAIKLGVAKMPKGSNWWALYGVALLTGIGFTMSLFISALAFEHTGFDFSSLSRLGVMMGSAMSAIIGVVVLRWALRENK